GRSVALSTAMTREGELTASRNADTEVYYMAGKQLAALSRRLIKARWAADTPVCVVSRAGWPDQLISEHSVGTLGHAAMLHAGRPSVVTVGAAALPVAPASSGLTQPKAAALSISPAVDNPQAQVAELKH
ncbi:MAG: SAM-dependent methyltransferase, partial [Rhizobacter sp.]